ncbi:CBS domain-containing protein [Bradyrhizobium elkanii]|uniref:CBS domain-containing protein n=1 Tax=Bradyrhizobium elkanii TaxID=29448 RepID=UPI003515641E
MSRNVITIDGDASVIDAIKTMLSHHISGLPVIDQDGALIGILSDGDFIRRVGVGTEKRRGRWLAMLAGTNQVALDFARQHGRKVSQIMSPDPITVEEDTSLEQVVQLMESHGVTRFPVMRDRMVTRTDFMTAIARLRLEWSSISGNDDQIRASVIAAFAHAPWRPAALDVSVNDGIVSLRGSIRSDNAHKAAIVCCGKRLGREAGRRPTGKNGLPAGGRGLWRRRLCLVRARAFDRRRSTLVSMQRRR